MTATMTAAELAELRRQVENEDSMMPAPRLRPLVSRVEILGVFDTVEIYRNLQAELVALLADAYDAQGKPLEMQWYSATADAMLRARALMEEDKHG